MKTKIQIIQRILPLEPGTQNKEGCHRDTPNLFSIVAINYLNWPVFKENINVWFIIQKKTMRRLGFDLTSAIFVYCPVMLLLTRVLRWFQHTAEHCLHPGWSSVAPRWQRTHRNSSWLDKRRKEKIKGGREKIKCKTKSQSEAHNSHGRDIRSLTGVFGKMTIKEYTY